MFRSDRGTTAFAAKHFYCLGDSNKAVLHYENRDEIEREIFRAFVVQQRLTLFMEFATRVKGAVSHSTSLIPQRVQCELTYCRDEMCTSHDA